MSAIVQSNGQVWHSFSAGKMLAASCLHCVNCRLNPQNLKTKSLFLCVCIVHVTWSLQPIRFD